MSHLQHKLPASFSLNPGRRNPPAALKVALPSGAIFNRAAHNVSASLERPSLPVRRKETACIWEARTRSISKKINPTSRPPSLSPPTSQSSSFKRGH